MYGGGWLWIGLIVLGITLLYWGREFLRDYDHLPSSSTAMVATGGTALAPGSMPPPGALPTPQGTPPPGVHIPAPSFRPLLDRDVDDAPGRRARSSAAGR